eukprot:scaffold2206_cov316-Pavlova_lutheri.AAC.6
MEEIPSVLGCGQPNWLPQSVDAMHHITIQCCQWVHSSSKAKPNYYVRVKTNVRILARSASPKAPVHLDRPVYDWIVKPKHPRPIASVLEQSSVNNASLNCCHGDVEDDLINTKHPGLQVPTLPRDCCPHRPSMPMSCLLVAHT